MIVALLNLSGSTLGTAWRRSRRAGVPTAGHFQRRPQPSRTRPRQSHHNNHPPALPATQLPATPATIPSTCARVQGGGKVFP